MEELFKVLEPKTDAQMRSDTLRYMRGEYTNEEVMWEVFQDLFGIAYGVYLFWCQCELEVIAAGGFNA